MTGGHSRRMGQDKALIDWRGQPLIARIVDRLRGCEPVVVVCAPQQFLPDLPGALLIADPADRAGRGPLAAIVTGLTLMAKHDVTLAFLTGCDAPFVSARHARALAGRVTSDDDAVAVHQDGHIQFLSAAVRVETVLETAARLLETGERSLHALFSRLRVRALAPHSLPEARAARTFNTPEQLAELRALDT